MAGILRDTLRNYLTNISGWSTKRKIIVIESDDWGSIRMPSRSVYEQCLKAGYRVDQIAYERYDSLASEEDLELLFEVLYKHHDKNRSPAVITANVLVANPDFGKIKSSGFQNYSYELITNTFEKYPKHSRCFKYWEKGLTEGIFYPQSHGREHLNVSMFMKALQEKNEDVMFGFEHEMPGSIPKGEPAKGNKYVESLRFLNQQDKNEKLSIIIDGLELFEALFGYQSASFTPPNYIWSPDYDKSASENGIIYYQGRRKMIEPDFNGGFHLNRHRLGETNKNGQTYLVRNATFEPALSYNIQDPVDKCLKDISIAFQLNKPAIICSHRVNYVGFIDPKNRDRNLVYLDTLLRRITKRWPDVEFMHSVQLGKLMTDKH